MEIKSEREKKANKPQRATGGINGPVWTLLTVTVRVPTNQNNTGLAAVYHRLNYDPHQKMTKCDV